MNEVQNVKWCMKQTKLTSEIVWPTHTRQAQSEERQSEDTEDLDWGVIFD